MVMNMNEVAMSFLYSLKETLIEVFNEWYYTFLVAIGWGFLKLLIRYDKFFLFKAILYALIFGIALFSFLKFIGRV